MRGEGGEGVNGNTCRKDVKDAKNSGIVNNFTVIPAKAGIQIISEYCGPRLSPVRR
jgi:hypothetical protein